MLKWNQNKWKKNKWRSSVNIASYAYALKGLNAYVCVFSSDSL